MTATTPTTTGLLCAHPHCRKPIARQGDMWVHPDPNGGWYRNCDGGRSPDTATVEPLAVAHFPQRNTNTESFHAVFDGAEYVIWYWGGQGQWAAWRTTPPAPGTDDPIPAVTLYDGGPLHDPRVLIDAMPPLVAHWMAEVIYPF
jgi:hypothetical protein